MKTSIYTYLHEKWLEGDDDYSTVFVDDQRRAIIDAMVKALGGDSMYDQETLEIHFSILAREDLYFRHTDV